MSSPESFGAVGDAIYNNIGQIMTGTDNSSAFQNFINANPGGSITLTDSKKYRINTAVSIPHPFTITGNGGELVYGGASTEAATGGSTGILAGATSELTITGVKFVAPISVVLGTVPGCGAHVRVSRNPVTGSYLWKNVRIERNSFFGGQRGVSVQSIEQSFISGNRIFYAYEWGIVASFGLKNVQITDNIGHRIGITEHVRIGSSPPGAIENVFIARNSASYCGLLDPAALQDGYDIYSLQARGVVFTQNKAIGCAAGMMEMKWFEDSANLYNQYTDFCIDGNYNESLFNTKCLAARFVAAQTPGNQIKNASISNNVNYHREFSLAVDATTVTLSTTVNSRNVVATIPNYQGTIGDMLLLCHCTLANGVGGIPLHELSDPRYVIAAGGGTVTFECETVASATASQVVTGAASKLYIHAPSRPLGNNPIQTTNGSATVTVTDTGSNMTAGMLVTLAGVPNGTAGLTAAQWNKKFEIKTAAANTYTITLPAAATITGSVGGAAVKAWTERQNGVDFWFGQLDGLVAQGNKSIGGHTMFLLDSAFTTGDVTSTNMTIADNHAVGMLNGMTVRRMVVDRLKVTGNVFEVMKFGIYQDTSTNFGRISNGVISGNRIRVADSEGGGAAVALSLGSMQDSLIADNVILAQGYGVRQFNATGGGAPASANNAIVKNFIDVSNATLGRNAVDLIEGTGWQVSGNEFRASTTMRGVNISGGGVAAWNNGRGSTGAAPTAAGGVGEAFHRSPPAIGSPEKWICTTAGALGAAVWRATANL